MVMSGLYIDKCSCKSWYKDDLYHRLNGPAIEYNKRFQRIYPNGQRLVEWCDGFKDWYFNGKYICSSTQEEFERIIKLKMLW
jgi:hypothetical protein